MNETEALREVEKLPKKSIDEVADILSSLIEEELENFGAIDYVIGGSYGKGTDTENADIDSFISFPVSFTDEEFHKAGLGIGRKILRDHPHYEKFGDHPYCEGFIFGVRINIVPIFNVKKGEYRSAADRSKFHLSHVAAFSNEIKENIKNLKRTFKLIGIYGASQKTQGFSGYHTELLVDHFGSYDAVLTGFADLQSGTVINGNKDAKAVNRLTTYDAIDNNRNLSAALSDECLDKLILYARGVTLKPDLPSVKIDLSKITDDNEDEQTGRRRRELSKARTRFDRAGFVVLKTELDGDYGTLYLESLTLSTKVRQNGPPLEKREACEAYLASRPNAYSENGRLYCLVNRTYTDANVLAAEY